MVIFFKNQLVLDQLPGKNVDARVQLLRVQTSSDKQYKIISTEIFEILTLNSKSFLILALLLVEIFFNKI